MSVFKQYDSFYGVAVYGVDLYGSEYTDPTTNIFKKQLNNTFHKKKIDTFKKRLNKVFHFKKQ